MIHNTRTVKFAYLHWCTRRGQNLAVTRVRRLFAWMSSSSLNGKNRETDSAVFGFNHRERLIVEIRQVGRRCGKDVGVILKPKLFFRPKKYHQSFLEISDD